MEVIAAVFEIFFRVNDFLFNSLGWLIMKLFFRETPEKSYTKTHRLLAGYLLVVLSIGVICIMKSFAFDMFLVLNIPFFFGILVSLAFDDEE